MTEQQNHLKELLTQAEEIKNDINNLNAQAQSKKESLTIFSLSSLCGTVLLALSFPPSPPLRTHAGH